MLKKPSKKKEGAQITVLGGGDRPWDYGVTISGSERHEKEKETEKN